MIELFLILLIGWALLRRSLFKQAGNDLLAGRVDAAETMIRRAMRLLPRDATGHLNMAYVKWLCHDAQGVEKHLDRAIAIRRKNPGAYLARALLMTQIKHYDDALADLELAEQNSQPIGNIDVVRAHVYMERGDLERAQNLLDNVIADARNVTGKQPQFAAYMRGGLYQNSVALHWALAYRAMLHLRRESPDLAVTDYDAAINAYADIGVTYHNRGEVRFALNNYEGALADFQKSLETRPAHYTLIPVTVAEMSRAGLAVTHHALGQIDEAQTLWRDLTAENPRFRDLHWLKDELRWPQAMIDHAAQLDARVHGTAAMADQ
jgi:tetratricopeptide (TPR) repeat protein